MKATRYVAVFVLLCIGAWYLTRPAPNWYVSPPLDALGSRAKLRVPEGWMLDTRVSHLPHGILKPDDQFTLVFAPQETPLSRAFDRLLSHLYELNMSDKEGVDHQKTAAQVLSAYERSLRLQPAIRVPRG